MSKKKSGSGIYALFAKLGPKLLTLLGKLGKLFKLTKVGLAAASFAGYAAVYNWKFAILLMVALGWHESGHVWAMKRKGIKTKGFYFLPFIGGAAIAEEKCKSYWDNFYIAIMGPVWGAILAYMCMCVYLVTHAPMWAAATGFMCTLNLFNLLPIMPLDGGQIVKSTVFSITNKIGLYFLGFSFILSLLCFHFIHSGLFVLITIVGALDLYFEYRRYKRKLEIPDTYDSKTDTYQFESYPDQMNKWQIKMAGSLYIGLIIILFSLLLSIKHLPGADMAANFLS